MSSQTVVTDCLVYKIEEINYKTRETGIVAYIFYDTRTYKYNVRCKQYSSHSFECKKACDVVDFLMLITDRDNIINDILYGFDKFPENANDITFDALDKSLSVEHIITARSCGVNNRRKKYMLKYVQMLRKMSNKY